MSWVDSLSQADIADYLSATASMPDARIERAYVRLLLHIRRYGYAPVPVADEICGCTWDFWLDHCWPTVNRIFEVDAGRKIVERGGSDRRAVGFEPTLISGGRPQVSGR